MRMLFGWFFLLLGIYIGLFNFHLSFTRPLYYRWRGRPCKFISGVPLIGSVSFILAILLYKFDPLIWITALIVAMADTSGIHFCILLLIGEFLFHPRNIRSSSVGKSPICGRINGISCRICPHCETHLKAGTLSRSHITAENENAQDI